MSADKQRDMKKRIGTCVEPLQTLNEYELKASVLPSYIYRDCWQVQRSLAAVDRQCWTCRGRGIFRGTMQCFKPWASFPVPRSYWEHAPGNRAKPRGRQSLRHPASPAGSATGSPSEQSSLLAQMQRPARMEYLPRP